MNIHATSVQLSCLPVVDRGFMPTSSIIGMSVAVGGLFLLLIAVLLMITCMRRKHAHATLGAPPRGLDHVIPGGGARFGGGAGRIACPSISGEIIMREPPPRSVRLFRSRVHVDVETSVKWSPFAVAVNPTRMCGGARNATFVEYVAR